MINILVLFSCFNRLDKTSNCIHTLSDNVKIHIDYIILDDNSSDGTIDFLKRQKNVCLLLGNGDSYYSGGMRKAINKAKSANLGKYKYVMLVNDDVSFYPGSIDKLVDYENNLNEIIVGAVCDIDGNFSYGGERKASKFKPEYIHVEINEKNLYCDTTCANCVLIPKDVFLNLPNIDPTYHHAMGDFDYFFEARRQGYIIKSSNFYVGQCDDNSVKGGWRDCSLPRIERLRKKENVKGLPAKEWFHYLKKNYGVLATIYFSVTPYIRILFGI